MNYAIIKNGIVENIVIWDGESEWPELASAILSTDGVGIGWHYDNDVFSAPPPTNKELEAAKQQKIANNLATKNALMSEATQQISVLQDAVDLSMATDAETVALPLWKQYRVLLSRIDANTNAEISWPEKPA